MPHHSKNLYLTTKAMEATVSSMALASTVLGFQIVELWSQDSDGKFFCTYVHADPHVAERNPQIITGYYPNHKRPHQLSPMVSLRSIVFVSRLYR